MDLDKPEKAKKITKNYMKYSDIAFQMLALFVIAFVIGKQIDNWMGNAKPFIAICFTMVTFGGYMYKLYKELS